MNLTDKINNRFLFFTPTESFERFHQLDGEHLPPRKLLQHFGNFVVSTADEAMAVDGLDHVPNVDDLDLVDDAPLTDSLEGGISLVTDTAECPSVTIKK